MNGTTDQGCSFSHRRSAASNSAAFSGAGLRADLGGKFSIPAEALWCSTAASTLRSGASPTITNVYSAVSLLDVAV